MLSVPLAGVEVREPIGFEQGGAVDEPGLFGEGVVSERFGIPNADVSGVLERATAVGAGCEGQEPATRGEAAMGFLHGVDRIADVKAG